ncbi:MAG: sigma-E processing peptidase SpoIIGA [Clostridia bacterium]
MLASSIGAIYTLIAYVSRVKNIFKCIFEIIISYCICNNPQNIKKLFKDLIVFYLTSFVFGGAAFSIIYIVKPQEILKNNGLVLTTKSLRIILISAIIAFLTIITAFKIVKGKITDKNMYCEVEIEINKRKIITKAMIDTGNLLKEPITNTPVIVVEHTLLYECLPKEILNNLEKILGGDFEEIPNKIEEEYKAKLKVIPFSSLGKQNGMLLGIKPNKVIIKYDDEIKEIKNIIIGIYNKSLTKRRIWSLIGLNNMI